MSPPASFLVILLICQTCALASAQALANPATPLDINLCDIQAGFAAAPRRSPTDTDLLLRCSARFLHSDLNRAERYALIANAYTGVDKNAHAMLGVIYTMKHNFDAAEGELKTAIALDQRSASQTLSSEAAILAHLLDLNGDVYLTHDNPAAARAMYLEARSNIAYAGRLQPLTAAYRAFARQIDAKVERLAAVGDTQTAPE